MNPEEQTVTWLITLGVLNSPKKTIADPEDFLKASLKDGVVLCKLMERLLPGPVSKVIANARSRIKSNSVLNVTFQRMRGRALTLQHDAICRLLSLVKSV